MTVPSVAEDRPQDQTPAGDAAASASATDDAERTPAASTDAPPAPAAPATDTAGAAADGSKPPADSAETPTAVADGAPEATADGAQESAEGAKRRVRLNPTFDPQRVKPIPTLGPAGSQPGQEAGAPAETTPVAADEAAADAAPTAAAAEEGAEAAVDSTAASAEPEAVPPRGAPSVEIPSQADLDAEMEAEIAAALESSEVGIAPPSDDAVEAAAAGEAGEEQPAAPPTLETANEGTKLKGTIQSIHEDNVFLDFGWRLSGVVSLRQFNPKKPPKVGDTADVVVVKVDEDEGLIACRLPRGRSGVSGDWHSVSPGQVVDCLVTKTNKGGLEISVGNLRGFMPASQVEIGYVADLQTFVGQRLQAQVTEVNPARRRLVVSRRQILQEERAVAEQELMQHLEAGQTVTGKVKTIKEYGAFIDIGGVDGFLHIGQMSWVRINHPNEILTEGQDVDVKVLSIDEEKKKISLGMRQLSANPWANVEMKYAKGSTVTGKVTRTEPFGAFVELEPGVEGLVHISELDYKRVRAVTDVLNVGQMAQVQVLEVNPQKKRVSLSVKALLAKPEDAQDSAPVDAPKYIRKSGLKGGIGGDVKGGLFGDPNKFG